MRDFGIDFGDFEPADAVDWIDTHGSPQSAERYLIELADVCRAAGLEVVEVDGWQTRARGSGGYDGTAPWCVMWHHTASNTSPENDVGYICFGCPDAPVANLYLARDGVVWVCAAGATNTNGTGGPFMVSSGVVPADRMNEYAVSIEAANDGLGQVWPQVQIDAYFRLSLAVTNWLGLPPGDVCTHAAWTTRKIDPARAEAVEGPWQPAGVNSSGTWSLDSIIDELWVRSEPPSPPTEDELSQADIDAINARLDTLTAAVNDRQAVWNSPNVGNQNHANNPAMFMGDLWDAIENISRRLP